MSEATTHRLSEAQWQRQVLDLAKAFGWLAYHTHDSRHSAAGYPDLTLVRDDRLMFAELKTDVGKLSAEQCHWLDALAAAGQTVHVWRPGQWDEIVELLCRRGA